jgi:hypothetical protein
MAPESLQEKVYGTKTDVYSFAVTIWEIASREIVHKTLDPVTVAMKVVYEDLRPTIPDNCYSLWIDLMKACWAKNPEFRPSFSQICEVIDGQTFVVLPPAFIQETGSEKYHFGGSNDGTNYISLDTIGHKKHNFEKIL